ncbi:MAG TPA: hypothetical protein VGQ41_23465 [Pyrinomonadaceae bacterium]|jgi:hypothetical protein|nr:hypothetical protein [Pyrinomonadaceae bacterium]
MAQLLNHAQPGDVITAEDWNLVVDAINELLQSGQSSGIKVAALLPAGTAIDPIRIGTITQVTGQNFGFSIGQSKVTFEAGNTTATVLRANMLTGSFDERLLFMMPPVPGMTSAGLNMTMRVSNGIADDTRSVFVMPVVIDLTGDMFVTWRGDVAPNPKPNPLESGAGKSAEFRYRLQTGINIPASFNLSAEILNATVPVPAGLVDTIEFRDDADSVISGRQLQLGKNETRNITVRIPEIPTAFTSQTFTLKVTAAAGSVVGTDQRTFTVGAPVIPPDPNIEANQTAFSVLDGAGNAQSQGLQTGVLDGSTIRLKAGFRGVVNFSTRFTKAGTYEVTILPKQGSTLTGWTPEMTPDSIGTRGPESKVTIQVLTDNETTLRTEKFRVTPVAGASPTGTIVFRIKRLTSASEFSKEYGLQLLP